jgi:hypothetical protein
VPQVFLFYFEYEKVSSLTSDWQFSITVAVLIVGRKLILAVE